MKTVEITVAVVVIIAVILFAIGMYQEFHRSMHKLNDKRHHHAD